MKLIDGAEKRGRPDLVHFALMEALSTPLYIDRLLQVFVHTVANKVIKIEADNLRIPKSYFRFEGLMVELFRNKVVQTQDGTTLMRVEDLSLDKLLDSISPAKVIGLSSVGVKSTAEEVARRFTAVGEDSQDGNCVFVIGGFPRGHFSESVSRSFNFTYSISDIGLEAHVVIARLIYECEKALGVHQPK